MATDPFVMPASGDLALPALVAIAALLLFLVLLAFQTKKAPKPLLAHEVAELGDHGEKELVASVFVQENGQVVRRSTRPRKPTGETPVKTASDETTTPKVKTTSVSTRSKTPAKTPSAVTEASAPASDARDEQASPPRTRSRRTPRA